MRTVKYQVHKHKDLDQAYYGEDGDYYIETYTAAKDDCGETIEILSSKKRADMLCKLMNEGKLK